MKEQIAVFIRKQAYKPMTAAELAEAMKVPTQQEKAFSAALAQLESEGQVVKNRFGRYGAPERMNLAVGRLSGHPKGFAFLTPELRPEGVEGDIFVGPENLAGAMHNDRVVVRLSPPARPGARHEGEVIRILERATQRLVGTFEGSRAGGFVTPDDLRFPQDVVIPRGQAGGAKSGEKVVVRITAWPEARRPAQGQVVERLGPRGDVGVDILSIVRAHDLPEAFPVKVLREAEAIPEEIPAAEYDQRADLRDLPFVTIDGEDARDLDDAVLVQRKGDRWQLWVAIADVSFYVRENSALDREAYRRGTSVYLADRVLPMLPPRLSNHICSLSPGVDRLTMTCEMEIDAQGKVVRHAIYPAVIRTVARMTYAAVNAILGETDPELSRQHASLAPVFHEMRSLMEVLRRRRLERGSLDFELPEAKLILGEQGQPLDVRRVERGVAERMIEEFMLVANETVAEHLAKQKAPCAYRVHEPPTEEKAGALAEFLRLFGYNLAPGKKGLLPRQLQAVTAWAAGRKEAGLINTVLLRSMQQARYSHENLGHFGLAAAFYCHFTSPIRRYPDLLVHRILRELWEKKGSLPGKRKSRLEKVVAEAAEHASVRERVAVEAERETYNLKKAQFMQDKVGESFAGIISGVTQFGFFVQLPNTVEGLVHVSQLDDDYYLFQPEQYVLMGQRTRRFFRLGDPVTVRVAGVDLARRSVDFALEAGPPAFAERTLPAPARTVAAAAQEPARTVAATAPEPERMAAAAQEPARPALRIAPAPAAKEPPARPIKRAETAGAETRRPAARSERAAAPRPSGRRGVDMWGVPIPNDRPRRREDEDEGEQSPLMFSLSPGQARNDSRRGGPKAAADETAPAPARAIETGKAAGPVPSGENRRRRRPVQRRKPPAEQS